MGERTFEGENVEAVLDGGRGELQRNDGKEEAGGEGGSGGGRVEEGGAVESLEEFLQGGVIQAGERE